MVYGYKHGVHKEYCCRHSTTGADWKKEMVNATDNEADLYDMTAGERYTIQVNTVSYGTESKHPLLANHTVRKSYPHQSFVEITIVGLLIKHLDIWLIVIAQTFSVTNLHSP